MNNCISVTPYFYWVPNGFAISNSRFYEDSFWNYQHHDNPDLVFRMYKGKMGWYHAAMTRYDLLAVSGRPWAMFWLGLHHSGGFQENVVGLMDFMADTVEEIMTKTGIFNWPKFIKEVPGQYPDFVRGLENKVHELYMSAMGNTLFEATENHPPTHKWGMTVSREDLKNAWWQKIVPYLDRARRVASLAKRLQNDG